MSAGASRPPAPSTVNAAFWLYIAGAALGLVSIIVALVIGLVRLQSGGFPDGLPTGTDVSPTVLSTALAVGLALGLVVGLVSIAAYVVFAVLMRRGANWARIVLTVLSAVALVSGLVGLLVLNLLNLLVSVLVVVAAVLLWQRPSNAWFARAEPPRPYD